MKIAVCCKCVPDTETKIALASDNQSINLAGVRFAISPYDEFAVEEALRLKEKHGGETVVIAVGGDEVTSLIRDEVLARGVDAAIHVKDASLVNLDPLSTAKVLAAVIKEGGFDLVLCGQIGVGGDNGQVPSMLAELLNMPQATCVVKLEVDGSKFKAEREIEGAHENIEGSLPAVISAQKGLNEIRYPSIKGVMAAKRKEITVKDAASLGVKVEPKLRLKEMTMPPERPSGKKIDGDPQTQAKTLVDLLRSEARVI